MEDRRPRLPTRSRLQSWPGLLRSSELSGRDRELARLFSEAAIALELRFVIPKVEGLMLRKVVMQIAVLFDVERLAARQVWLDDHQDTLPFVVRQSDGSGVVGVVMNLPDDDVRAGRPHAQLLDVRIVESDLGGEIDPHFADHVAEVVEGGLGIGAAFADYDRVAAALDERVDAGILVVPTIGEVAVRQEVGSLRNQL